MSQQYDLYNNNTSSVPNIYFLGTSEDNQYDSSNQTQNYINPNSIKNNCANQASNQSSYLINPSDESDEIRMTRDNNYDNFLWRYATNRLNDNTSVNLSNNNKTTYGQIQEGAKNQLEYLGCQVLKESNKIYDQNNSSLTKIDQKTWILLYSSIVFVILNLSFIIKSFFREKSSFITLFSDISRKINGNYVALFGAILSSIIIAGGLIFSGIPTRGNDENKEGSDYLLFNSFSPNSLSNDMSVGIGTIIVIIVLIISILLIFNLRGWYNNLPKGWKSACLVIPLALIIAVYIVNYLVSTSIARFFTVSNSTTNTCKNITENDTDNTKIIWRLLTIYLVTLIFYFWLIGLNKKNTSFTGFKSIGVGFLNMFGIITPLILLVFECSFAILQPIIYFFVIIVIRILVYLFSFVKKSKVTAVLFNYPVSYFNKMKDSNIKINYPTTLPSGASWNTVSILIFKLFFLFVNRTSKGLIEASDFNFFNSLDA